MMTVILSLVLFLPGSLSHESTLQGAVPALAAARPSEDVSFPPGETSRYDLWCLFAKVGKGEIEYLGEEELGGIPVHHVRSSFSRLGAVDDEDIYGTADDYLPLVVKRRIDSLGGLRVETEKYDQENYRIEIDKKRGDTVESETISSDEEIQNLILLFFDLRRHDLKPGLKIPVNLPRQKFVLEVQGLTDVDVPAGSFSAYEVSSENGELRLWIAAGTDPVVLRASLQTPLFGNYSMILTGHGCRL